MTPARDAAALRARGCGLRDREQRGPAQRRFAMKKGEALALVPRSSRDHLQIVRTAAPAPRSAPAGRRGLAVGRLETLLEVTSLRRIGAAGGVRRRRRGAWSVCGNAPGGCVVGTVAGPSQCVGGIAFGGGGDQASLDCTIPTAASASPPPPPPPRTPRRLHRWDGEGDGGGPVVAEMTPPPPPPPRQPPPPGSRAVALGSAGAAATHRVAAGRGALRIGRSATTRACDRGLRGVLYVPIGRSGRCASPWRPTSCRACTPPCSRTRTRRCAPASARRRRRSSPSLRSSSVARAARGDRRRRRATPRPLRRRRRAPPSSASRRVLRRRAALDEGRRHG